MHQPSPTKHTQLGRHALGRKDVVEEKGFFILPADLFQNVRARGKSNPNLNETLARVFANIEASSVGTPSERDFKGLFDDLDVNSNKLGPTVAKRNERLVKLLDAIGDLPLGGAFGENTNDLFGDAYEYLMGMYASAAGKSGGEYYTPQEVSELLARIAVAGKTELNKVYDPACGSGALLLKFAKVLGPDKVRTGFYGQEINLSTYNLARINMFLHDVPYEKFDIAHGDTLTDPAHWDDEPFEAIVSNPPYSLDWAGDADVTLINDERYAPAGVLAPKSKADLAFVMHMLHWLAVDGTAAIVEYPGVLYRGGAEQKIREYLVSNNYVDAVIQLPPDLFFGTTIATCIIVLKKSKATSDIAFIEASGEFVRRGNKNMLSPLNQQRLLDALAARIDVEHFVKIVPNDEVLANTCKLSASAWVEGVDAREAVDIPALNAEIAEIVSRQADLRTKLDAIVAELEILAAHCSESVEVRSLGDVGTFIRGNGILKKDLVGAGTPAIHYGQIFTHYGTVAHETRSFVDGTLAQRAKKAEHGDLVIATTSENDADVCRAVAWLGPVAVAVSGDAYIYKHTLDPKYMAYFFQSADFQAQKARHITGTKVRRLNGADMAGIRIPVPLPAVQAEIAKSLELMEEAQTQLRAELSAESAARRMQFESYRNRLLAFPSLPSQKAAV